MQTIDGKQLMDGLLKRAREEGRDLFEVMESEGFMLTRVRRRQVKVDALKEVLYILERETAERVLQRYLGGRPATAQDMFDAMLEWLIAYRDALEAGHVG